MRLLCISDLHLEHGLSFTVPEVEFDVVVLAGDIHSPGRRAVHWAQRESTFGGKPVVLVAGNHEFYGCEMATELREMKKAAEGSNVHVLARGSVVIGGVRFLGCTLWTDFQLPITEANRALGTDVARALFTANRGLNDFQEISVDAPPNRMGRPRMLRLPLRAEDTLVMHWVDRDWLRRSLLQYHEGPTVVVTHHAPTIESVAARHIGDALSPAFASELPDSLFQTPSVWVHGHTHSSADYRHQACRVISNPRGYRLKDGSMENERFSSGMVVPVGALQ